MSASRARSLVLVVLTTAGLLLLGRAHVLEPVRIESSSMQPTLSSGQHVLVWKSPVTGRDWQRQDVVALRRGEVLLVKRVVATAGDRVAIRDGRLVVNGERVREPWSAPRLIDSTYFGPVDVPEGTVFVLGDNRSESIDSRDFGPVAERQLEGRVVASWWPPGPVGGGASR